MKPQPQATRLRQLRRGTAFLCVLFLFLAQFSPQSTGQSPQSGQAQSSPTPTEDSGLRTQDSSRLIIAIHSTNNLPVPADVLGLIEWPAVETLNLHQARQDRSVTIPPLFRQPKLGDAKPIRLGARSPQAARKEAEQWIRRVIKPQWLPDDLADRLQLLQREPASQSIIVCRYAIDPTTPGFVAASGHAIQINQSRASMWVIIRPPKSDSLTQNGKEFGTAAFNAYFLDGNRMADLPGKETDGPTTPGFVAAGTAKLRVWLPDYSAPMPAGALENWWGWRLWLTDGEAVAVLLNKCSEDSARNIMPDDPWF